MNGRVIRLIFFGLLLVFSPFLEIKAQFLFLVEENSTNAYRMELDGSGIIPSSLSKAPGEDGFLDFLNNIKIDYFNDVFLFRSNGDDVFITSSGGFNQLELLGFGGAPYIYTNFGLVPDQEIIIIFAGIDNSIEVLSFNYSDRNSSNDFPQFKFSHSPQGIFTVGSAYSEQQSRMYYNTSEGELFRFDPSGGNFEEEDPFGLPAQFFGHIAVDDQRQHFYWTNGSLLYRINLNGDNQTLVNNDDLSQNVRGLKVNPYSGEIYVLECTFSQNCVIKLLSNEGTFIDSFTIPSQSISDFDLFLDPIPPILQTTAPAIGSTVNHNPGLTLNVTFNFNKAIQFVPGIPTGDEGRIGVYANGDLLAVYDRGDPQLSISGNAMIINDPNVPGIPGSEYHFLIGNEFISNTSGARFAGVTDPAQVRYVVDCGAQFDFTGSSMNVNLNSDGITFEHIGPSPELSLLAVIGPEGVTTPVPVDGTDYFASPVYGNGEDISPMAFVVYSGPVGQEVTVTDMPPGDYTLFRYLFIDNYEFLGFDYSHPPCNYIFIDEYNFEVCDPPAPPVSEDSEVCFGGSSTLTVSTGGANGTFSWYLDEELTSLVNTGEDFNTAQVNPGEYTYYVTETNAEGCESIPVQVTLTIRNSLGQPGPIVGQASVCPEEELVYSLAAPPGTQPFGGDAEYVWNIPATWSVVDQDDQSITLTSASATGDFNISVRRRYVNSPSCFSPESSIGIVTNPNPAAVNSETGPLCETIPGGGTTSFTIEDYNAAVSSGAGGVTVSWFTDPGLTESTSGTVVASDDEIFYAQVVNNTTGCSSTAQLTVEVVSTPEVILSQSTENICDGESINVNIDGAPSGVEFTYEVTFSDNVTGASDGAGNQINQQLNLIGSGIGTVVYQITPGLGVCSGLPEELTVLVFPGPQAFDLTGETSICPGDDGSEIGLSGSEVGAEYNLFRDGTSTGAVEIGVGTAISFGLFDTPGTYTIQATTIDGCSAQLPTSLDLQFFPLPDIVNSSDSFCETVSGTGVRENVDLTSYDGEVSAGASGVDVAWFSDAVLSNPVADPTSVSVSNGQVIYARVRNQSSGCFDIATLNVSVSTTPAFTGSTSASICSGQTFSIPLNANLAGSTFTFTVLSQDGASGASDGTFTGTGGTLSQTLTTTGNQPGIVTYAMVVTRDGCSSDPVNLVITVNNPPRDLAVSGSGTICDGDSQVISIAESDPGVNYRLIFQGSQLGSPVAGNGNTITFPPVSAEGTYGIIATSPAGCTTELSQTVNIIVAFPPTDDAVITGNSVNCAGEEFSLSILGGDGGTSVEWSLPTGFQLVAASGISATIVSSSEGTFSISATVVNDCGTVSTNPFNTLINPVPVVSIVAPSTGVVEVPVIFDFESDFSISQVLWVFGDGATSTVFPVDHTYFESGDYTVNLQATDLNGCTGTATHNISVSGVERAITIFNLLTPNGDGFNDQLKIENIEQYPRSEVLLIDRFGNEVFKKSGYQNDWDLKINGQIIPAGNYVCIVRIPELGEVFKSTITVIRGNTF